MHCLLIHNYDNISNDIASFQNSAGIYTQVHAEPPILSVVVTAAPKVIVALLFFVLFQFYKLKEILKCPLDPAT
jgi:hypothetical protein